MGEARAEAIMASTVARPPQSMAGRAERVPSYLLPAAASFPIQHCGCSALGVKTPCTGGANMPDWCTRCIFRFVWPNHNIPVEIQSP
jgi:hypothetical protein